MENTISYHRVNSFVDVYIYIYVIATWSRAYLMSLTPRPFIARLTASYAYSLVRSSRLYRLPSLTTMIDDHRLYLDKGLASSFYFFFFFSNSAYTRPRSKDVIRTCRVHTRMSYTQRDHSICGRFADISMTRWPIHG